MKESENQQDQILKTLFKEVEVKGDLSITERVMQQINEVPVSKPVTYEPPISKQAWVLIGCAVAIMVLFAMDWEQDFAYFQIPTISFDVKSVFRQIGNSFNFQISWPRIPELSIPYIATILAFNIAGVYFILSYRRMKRA